MSRIFSPPDIVWFNPKALDYSPDGLIVYCCGKCIVFARNNSGKLSIERKINVYPNKSSCVTFFKGAVPPGSQRLAVLLDTTIVKIFDYPSLKVLSSFQVDTGNPLRTIQFMNHHHSHIVCAHLNGHLSIWDVAQQGYVKKSDSKMKIRESSELLEDMSISKDDQICCIYNKGSLAIIDSNGKDFKVKLKKKLNEPLRQASWNDSYTHIIASTTSTQFYIVSTTGDVLTIKPPSKLRPLATVNKKLLASAGSWIGDNKIIFASVTGQVFKGELKDNLVSLELLENQVFTRSVFLATTFDQFVIAASLDRQFAIYNEAGELQSSISTLAGHVYDMKFHPTGSGHLAIASGDGRILLANANTDNISQVSQVNFKSKILTVAWHPTDELKLAAGTSDGEVVVADVSQGKNTLKKIQLNNNSNAVLSMAYCDIPLFSPYPCLLAVSNNKCHVCPPGQTKASLLTDTVDSLKSESFSFVLAKESLIFLGTNSGRVHTVCASALQVVSTTSPEKAPVMGIVDSTDMFAVVYGMSFVNIYKIQNNESNNEESIGCLPLHKVITSHGVINAFSWNLFNEGIFATGGSASVVEVWDINNCSSPKLSLNDVCPKDRVLSLSWSPVDENNLYIGCESNTVYMCDISDQPQKCLNIQFENKCTEKEQKKTTASSKSKSAKKSLFPLANDSGNKPKQEGLVEVLELEKGNRENDLTKIRTNAHLCYYNTELIDEGLNHEMMNHVYKMDMESALQVCMLKSDPVQVIEWAIDNKQIDHQLLAYAAGVSQEMYDRVCDVLIDAKKNEDVHSVMHLMFIKGRIDELIDVLIEKHHYREAISFVLKNDRTDQARLKKVYLAWAERHKCNGNYEKCCSCYIAIGDFKSAVEILSLYNDASSAKTALFLAKRNSLSGCDELMKRSITLALNGLSFEIIDEVEDEFATGYLRQLARITEYVKLFVESCKSHSIATDSGLEFIVKNADGQCFLDCIETIKIEEQYYDELAKFSTAIPSNAGTLRQCLVSCIITIALELCRHQTLSEECLEKMFKDLSMIDDGRLAHVAVMLISSPKRDPEWLKKPKLDAAKNILLSKTQDLSLDSKA